MLVHNRGHQVSLPYTPHLFNSANPLSRSETMLSLPGNWTRTVRLSLTAYSTTSIFKSQMMLISSIKCMLPEDAELDLLEEGEFLHEAVSVDQEWAEDLWMAKKMEDCKHVINVEDQIISPEIVMQKVWNATPVESLKDTSYKSSCPSWTNNSHGIVRIPRRIRRQIHHPVYLFLHLHLSTPSPPS